MDCTAPAPKCTLEPVLRVMWHRLCRNEPLRPCLQLLKIRRAQQKPSLEWFTHPALFSPRPPWPPSPGFPFLARVKMGLPGLLLVEKLATIKLPPGSVIDPETFSVHHSKGDHSQVLHRASHNKILRYVMAAQSQRAYRPNQSMLSCQQCLVSRPAGFRVNVGVTVSLRSMAATLDPRIMTAYHYWHKTYHFSNRAIV